MIRRKKIANFYPYDGTVNLDCLFEQMMEVDNKTLNPRISSQNRTICPVMNLDFSFSTSDFCCFRE